MPANSRWDLIRHLRVKPLKTLMLKCREIMMLCTINYVHQWQTLCLWCKHKHTYLSGEEGGVCETVCRLGSLLVPTSFASLSHGIAEDWAWTDSGTWLGCWDGGGGGGCCGFISGTEAAFGIGDAGDVGRGDVQTTAPLSFSFEFVLFGLAVPFTTSDNLQCIK